MSFFFFFHLSLSLSLSHPHKKTPTPFFFLSKDLGRPPGRRPRDLRLQVALAPRGREALGRHRPKPPPRGLPADPALCGRLCPGVARRSAPSPFLAAPGRARGAPGRGDHRCARPSLLPARLDLGPVPALWRDVLGDRPRRRRRRAQRGGALQAPAHARRPRGAAQRRHGLRALLRAAPLRRRPVQRGRGAPARGRAHDGVDGPCAVCAARRRRRGAGPRHGRRDDGVAAVHVQRADAGDHHHVCERVLDLFGGR